MKNFLSLLITFFACASLPATASDFSGVTVVLATPVMIFAAILYGILSIISHIHRYVYRAAIILSIPLGLIGIVCAVDGLSNLGTPFAKYSYAYYIFLAVAIWAFTNMVRRHGNRTDVR